MVSSFLENFFLFWRPFAFPSLSPFPSPSVFLSPSSSSCLTPAMKDVGEYRNWAELPPELTSSILHRLGAVEILGNAQKVCMSWRSVSKDSSMWRKIDMHDFTYVRRIRSYDILCRHAVDLSLGGLVEIDLWNVGSDELLNYIAQRSSNLRALIFEKTYSMTDEGFVKAFKQIPLLEFLHVSYGSLSSETLKVVGQSCPNLKTLKLIFPVYRVINDDEFDNEAIAIAESMPQLRHLQLFGYEELTNTGLSAILDGCLHLEFLDIRMCSNIELVGELEKRCSLRIKHLRRPDDSVADHSSGLLYEIDPQEVDSSYDSDNSC